MFQMLDKLVAQPPQLTKIKRKDVCNTTDVIGVAHVKERTRSGKLLQLPVLLVLRYDRLS
jgi:hypothetical protein